MKPGRKLRPIVYGLSAKAEAFYAARAAEGLIPSPEAVAAIRADEQLRDKAAFHHRKLTTDGKPRQAVNYRKLPPAIFLAPSAPKPKAVLYIPLVRPVERMFDLIAKFPPQRLSWEDCMRRNAV